MTVRVVLDYLADLMFPLVPLYIAVYLVYLAKLRADFRRFSRLFTMINTMMKVYINKFPPTVIRFFQHLLGALTFLVFLLHWIPGIKEVQEDRLITSIIASILAFALFNLLKLHRNDVEDEMKISKSKHNMAPGLALPFFQVIEGIIRGNPERNELSYDEARDRYTKENSLDPSDWISDKIVILFLESELHRGSSKDIREMERVAGEEHVTLSNLTLTNTVNIQPRESVLNVVKIKKVFDKYHWQNNYVVIAENRPLQVLLEMKNISDNEIEFTQTDYELQYKLYYEELKRLVGENEYTRNKVELFHYSDNTKFGAFTKHLKRVVQKMKNEAANK